MYRKFVLGALMLSLAATLAAQQTPPAAPAASGNKLLSDDVNGDLPKWLRWVLSIALGPRGSQEAASSRIATTLIS